jgi:hypothetical protein
MKRKITLQRMSALLVLTGLLISSGPVYAGGLITEVVRTGSSSASPEITEPFGEYAQCFVDRIYFYANLPSELPDLVGAEYIMTADNDKNIDDITMDVTLSANAIVYLILDNQIGSTGGGLGVDPILDEELAWVYDMGFVDTGFDIGINEGGDGFIDEYSSIFVAELPAGTHTFGEQHDGVIRNMYGIVAVPMEITILTAAIDIKPETLNLKSRSRWITSLLWLPEEYDLYEIDPQSILLEGSIEASKVVIDDETNTMVIKFLREELQDTLVPGEVILTVIGQLYDGTAFEGSDMIRVK